MKDVRAYALKQAWITFFVTAVFYAIFSFLAVVPNFTPPADTLTLGQFTNDFYYVLGLPKYFWLIVPPLIVFGINYHVRLARLNWSRFSTVVVLVISSAGTVVGGLFSPLFNDKVSSEPMIIFGGISLIAITIATLEPDPLDKCYQTFCGLALCTSLFISSYISQLIKMHSDLGVIGLFLAIFFGLSGGIGLGLISSAIQLVFALCETLTKRAFWERLSLVRPKKPTEA